MSIFVRMLRQDAVYWKPLRDVNGNIILDDESRPTFDNPVQIKCRWDDLQELYRNAEGEEVMSSAKVYMDRDGERRGLLKKSLLNDLASLDPYENLGVYEIQMFSTTPDLKAKRFLRLAML